MYTYHGRNTFDKEQIYQKAFELVSRVMPTNAFLISFYNEGDSEIYIPFAMDGNVRYESRTLTFGTGNILSQVIQSKETLHYQTDREYQEVQHDKWGNPEQETSTCIFVPMFLGDQLKGVISAQSYREFAYRKEHEELLKIIGFQVASAIETATLYEKLYHASIRDELTSLKNHRAFHQDLEEAIVQAQDGDTVTLIMLDSDNLKRVNDQYGHHAGDMFLKHLTATIQLHLDEGEEAYRYAGDEFMIIAKGLSPLEAEQKVRKIYAYSEQNPFIYLDHTIPLSFSAGITSYPEDATCAESLKRLADNAMYESKFNGKNCVTVSSLK